MLRTNQLPVDRHAGPSRKRGPWTALGLVLLLLSAPLLYDGAKLCHARWLTMFGPKPMVSTPALDLVGSYIDDARDEVRRLSRQPFRKIPWRVEWVVGGLASSLAAGALLLRFNRLR